MNQDAVEGFVDSRVCSKKNRRVFSSFDRDEWIPVFLHDLHNLLTHSLCNSSLPLQAFIVASVGLNHSLPWLKYTGDHFWVMWAVRIISLCACWLSRFLLVSHLILPVSYQTNRQH